MPLEIALENLDTREERQEFDVVKDDVEAQLHTEVQLIENIKDKLKVTRETERVRERERERDRETERDKERNPIPQRLKKRT